MKVNNNSAHRITAIDTQGEWCMVYSGGICHAVQTANIPPAAFANPKNYKMIVSWRNKGRLRVATVTVVPL